MLDVAINKHWCDECSKAAKRAEDKCDVGSVDKHRLTEEIYLLFWRRALAHLFDDDSLLRALVVHCFRTLSATYWALC